MATADLLLYGRRGRRDTNTGDVFVRFQQHRSSHVLQLRQTLATTGLDIIEATSCGHRLDRKHSGRGRLSHSTRS